MRARSAVLITPLVFWACGTSPVVINTVADGGTQPQLDASRDGGVGLGDAQIDDAGFNEDAGFQADAEPNDTGAPDAGGPCTYPAGAVEPMALNEVLSPYRWPAAIDPSGLSKDLDLAQVYCNSDQDYDWGQAELLLIVSSPAW